MCVSGLRVLFVVGVMCCVLRCFPGLGEVASRDFGHEDEPFLRVYVYYHDDVYVLVWGVSCMFGHPVGFL